MSQGVYMKILSHIVTDNEKALEKAKEIQNGLNHFIKSVYGENADESAWLSYSHQTESDFEEITAVFSEVVGGSPRTKIDELLSEINTLENGSYGLLLCDTDYGVMDCNCYGSAEFQKIAENETSGYLWSSDDSLCLEKVFAPENLAELLDCDAEDVCDELEDNYEEIAEKLIPQEIVDILPADEDESPFYSCETEEDDDTITVKFLLPGHDYTTEQLQKFRKVFSGNSSNWILHLSEASLKQEAYENIMICPEHNAIVTFLTADEFFGDLQTSTMHLL